MCNREGESFMSPVFGQTGQWSLGLCDREETWRNPDHFNYKLCKGRLLSSHPQKHIKEKNTTPLASSAVFRKGQWQLWDHFYP